MCFNVLDKYSLWIVSSKERGISPGWLIQAAVKTYYCRGSSWSVVDRWICNRVGGWIQCPVSKLGIAFNGDNFLLGLDSKGSIKLLLLLQELLVHESLCVNTQFIHHSRVISVIMLIGM